ncbi:MAG: glutathione S-transferase [Hyphomicrobiales bacterium]|nr:glutathione S-transferase [Hyphomicrobiales bacterium]
MKIHWSPRSPYVRKVMLAAHELGLQDRLERQRTVVAMSSSNADLRADNPLNKIPTLVLDDGLAIFDSYVICEYLDDLAGGGRIIPPRGRERLLAQRLHALGQGFLDLLILMRNERDRADTLRSEPHMKAFADKRAATLEQLEREAPEFARAPFGIGHIAIGCALSYWDFRFGGDPWREAHPQLAAWHATFEARPAAQATAFADG